MPRNGVSISLSPLSLYVYINQRCFRKLLLGPNQIQTIRFALRLCVLTMSMGMRCADVWHGRAVCEKPHKGLNHCESVLTHWMTMPRPLGTQNTGLGRTCSRGPPTLKTLLGVRIRLEGGN